VQAAVQAGEGPAEIGGRLGTKETGDAIVARVRKS
jgi:hypothetical protein